MIVEKRLDLALLERELAAADVVVSGLGLSVPEPSPEAPGELFTYDAGGTPAELPPEAGPVVERHVAPPLVVEFAGGVQVSAIVRTTSAAPLEVFRQPTEVRHVYRATVRITAIDATSGTAKDAEARMLFKRVAGSVVQVGATAVLWSAQDAQATGWTIQAAVDGTDLIISVAGAAGRTIDWAVIADLDVYAPGGLTV